MKKWSIGIVITTLALMMAPAWSADLPLKAPSAAPPTYSWAGFYLGGNIGGGWGRSNTDPSLVGGNGFTVVQSDLGSISPHLDGALGGAEAGYNWQMKSVVFGLETDIQATGQRGSSQLADTLFRQNLCIAPCVPPPPTPVNGTFNYSDRLPWFGTLRGRLGFTPAERWLVFATGGLAYGKIESDATMNVPAGACLAPCVLPPSTAGGSFSHTKTGWVVGGGVEAALGGNWTGKLEYLHIDLGDTTDTFTAALTTPFAGTYTINSHMTDDIVRAGLNYRFGG
jgi:outer membrane immunogenic protein